MAGIFDVPFLDQMRNGREIFDNFNLVRVLSNGFAEVFLFDTGIEKLQCTQRHNKYVWLLRAYTRSVYRVWVVNYKTNDFYWFSVTPQIGCGFSADSFIWCYQRTSGTEEVNATRVRGSHVSESYRESWPSCWRSSTRPIITIFNGRRFCPWPLHRVS